MSTTRTNAIHSTSFCGSRQLPTNRSGLRSGAREGRAGTSNVLRLQCVSSAPQSICTAEVPISSFRITSVRRRNRRQQRESRSSGIGCTLDGADGRREDVEIVGQSGLRQRSTGEMGAQCHPDGRRSSSLPHVVGMERAHHARRRSSARTLAMPHGDGDTGLEAVRAALDDDLDTPTALEIIDEASMRGGVSQTAALLGVEL